MAGGGVDKVDALGSQAIYIGGDRVGVAGEATRLVAQLIGENIDEVGLVVLHSRSFFLSLDKTQS